MSTCISVCLPNRALTFFLASLLVPFFLARPTLANEPSHDNQSKVVGGYFEEWSIYFAGYNIANLQTNGVADRLTHLTYAFGDATPTGCAIADSWADYQDPSLPSVSGTPYTGPLYGNFAALQQLKQLHPNLKVLISLAGADGFSAAASTAAGRQAMVTNWISSPTRPSTPDSALRVSVAWRSACSWP